MQNVHTVLAYAEMFRADRLAHYCTEFARCNMDALLAVEVEAQQIQYVDAETAGQASSIQTALQSKLNDWAMAYRNVVNGRWVGSHADGTVSHHQLHNDSQLLGAGSSGDGVADNDAADHDDASVAAVAEVNAVLARLHKVMWL